jgi:hypothetical protein
MDGPRKTGRTEMLKVRVSPSEKGTVERRARAAGLRVSELVRRRVATEKRELTH